MPPDDSHGERDSRLLELLEVLVSKKNHEAAPNFSELAQGDKTLEQELRGLWATMMLAEDFASAVVRPELVRKETLAKSPQDRSLPRTVDDYELLEEIGRGGMGVVYRAWQQSLQRVVAVKMLLRSELATLEDRQRFRTESLATAALDHPHIVAVYEVGEWDSMPYFSMQYIQGTNLAQQLREETFAGRRAAELLVPICRAIASAHRAGVLHRDLKPSNILLDQSGQPFVTDFGLAKRIAPGNQPSGSQIGDSIDTLTRSGAVIGTPGYMAPEQASGQQNAIGPATDVYALGAILYAMLTGRAPFQAVNPLDTLLMVLEQDPLPVRMLNPQVDPDLELIVLKCLQKPIELRYATADSLADDLEAWLRHEPIQARSSHFSQILSRAFRPTHHVHVLENWGLLWMWHAVVLLIVCLLTNGMQHLGVESRWSYAGLWTIGLGTWAAIFWNLRRRSGPVTFVERQIAHVWAASMACSTGLFIIEALLRLPPLTLSPVLGLVAGTVFIVKAGILSGEFYFSAAALFLTCIPMALYPEYGLSLFGIISALTFFLPGLKYYRQRRQALSTAETSPHRARPE